MYARTLHRPESLSPDVKAAPIPGFGVPGSRLLEFLRDGKCQSSVPQISRLNIVKLRASKQYGHLGGVEKLYKTTFGA